MLEIITEKTDNPNNAAITILFGNTTTVAISNPLKSKIRLPRIPNNVPRKAIMPISNIIS